MSASTTSVPEPVLGTTADGHSAARIGDTALAALPGRAGLYLAYGSGLYRPIGQWTRDDFYGHGRRLSSEEAFQLAVDEQFRHQVERSRLDRLLERGTASTPWGTAQWTTCYAPGIRKHGTAGHGGFELATECNQLVHECLRNPAGFYEEDLEWAAVAISFPELFTTMERQEAERVIRCPSSDDLRPISGLRKGGSGSSGFDVRRPATGAASVLFGWSCA